MNLEEFQSYKLNKESYSQLSQDLLVTYLLKEKRNGYFVEFGATDGIVLNNTYLLEKEYDWSGILAEPAKVYHEDLRNNRNSNIDTNCVYLTTGQTVNFAEFDMLSTISHFKSNGDWAGPDREANSKYYDVETISLKDLLDKYDAPEVIDYMSIDTEGSEYDILCAYDFSRQIDIFTIEHNYTHQKDKIFQLLSDRGYTRVFDYLSQWDDWYVSKELMAKLNV